ncbi:MAG TPA: HEAT repeat domain-containing protein [Polyangia bacterium]|nr:HEAT repeat domain-containing protein [Polyangia bacterium]
MRIAALVFLVGLLAWTPARAAERGRAAAALKVKTLPAATLEKLRADLRGADDDAAVAAAKQLGESGSAPAIDVLVTTLLAGTTPARAQVALDGLGPWGAPKAFDVLALYAGHRNNELRARAVKALAMLSDRRVSAILMERLGDAAAPVRAAAAEGLAARHDKQATTRLMMLVKRNDAGAAGPLGALATPDLIPKVAELQGGIDDGVLATTLGEYIKRDDVADKMRVEVVRQLGQLQGASATTALVEYLAMVPAKEDRQSRREAQKLVDERGNVK